MIEDNVPCKILYYKFKNTENITTIEDHILAMVKVFKTIRNLLELLQMVIVYTVFLKMTHYINVAAMIFFTYTIQCEV